MLPKSLWWAQNPLTRDTGHGLPHFTYISQCAHQRGDREQASQPRALQCIIIYDLLVVDIGLLLMYSS